MPFINQETLHQLWQWSKLKVTYFVISYEIVIKTNNLSIKHLDESRLQRLELMDDLRDAGLKYYEIANLLNLKGIISPTNKQYTPNLVERSLFKFLRRLKRENEIELVSVKEDYQIGMNNFIED